MSIVPRGGRDNSRNQRRPAWIVALTSKEDLIQIIILTTCFLSQVISERVMIICVAYSRLPITRTFKGNRKKVRVNGSSKKIAESKVKKQFYCTVNILITFNCRNVK